jgi:hypothetical protein
MATLCGAWRTTRPRDILGSRIVKGVCVFLRYSLTIFYPLLVFAAVFIKVLI